MAVLQVNVPDAAVPRVREMVAVVTSSNPLPAGSQIPLATVAEVEAFVLDYLRQRTHLYEQHRDAEIARQAVTSF